MPEPDRDLRDPVRIYVLWHPDCPEGPALARSLFDWFRGDPQNLPEAGYGIPVLYRSAPMGRTGESNGPRRIDPGRACVNVIVPLVDEHMVVDGAWRSYLLALVEHPAESFLVPVALSSAAYQLPERITRLNFLRLDRATDPKSQSWEERTRVRRERLLSLLTQALGRLLTGSSNRAGGQQRGAAPPPLKVFISHAKADGVLVAEAIRQAVLTHGQLQTFFDESDLAIGYAYEKELETGAGSRGEQGSVSTMAMIAVYTDAYAGRPWCQRELRLARRPYALPERESQVTCWRSKPLLVVEALEKGETRFLTEAGHAPVMAWSEDRVRSIIDRLVRDTLIYAYNERRASQLYRLEDGSRHALNCMPDLYTTLAIVRDAETPVRELMVPPPGPTRIDRQELEGLVGGLKIRTYDELLTPSDD